MSQTPPQPDQPAHAVPPLEAPRIVVREVGGPEAMVLETVPVPEPGPGELLVAVAAAGVNFVDVYHRSGVYPRPTPLTPGGEFAGTVVALGPGTAEAGFAIGDRVAAAESLTGSYAAYTLAKAERVSRVPDGIDLETAAAVLLQGLTMHYLTRSTWPIKPGDTALVHAAAGGMGLLLTQTVKQLGGTVIGTVSTAAKEELARAAGADHVIRYTEVPDLAAAVRAANGGKGVDVVYDGVGKDTFEASLGSLRPRGLLALYGGASGQVPLFNVQELNSRGSLFLTRPSLASYIADPAELAWRTGELFDLVLSGSLRVIVGARYPLADAAVAHADLEGRRSTGKLLLLV